LQDLLISQEANQAHAAVPYYHLVSEGFSEQKAIDYLPWLSLA
jgi:hypothetical protein